MFKDMNRFRTAKVYAESFVKAVENIAQAIFAVSDSLDKVAEAINDHE